MCACACVYSIPTLLEVGPLDVTEGARVAEIELHPPLSPEFTFCDEFFFFF